MSSPSLRVIKMHGAGNDFVLLDRPPVSSETLPALASRLCDRHFGLGADGMLVISDSQIADVKMRIFNADGGEAEMCGNGIRCVGKYIYETGCTDNLTPTVETLAGVKRLSLHPSDDDHAVFLVSVDMGEAQLSHGTRSLHLSLPLGDYDVTPVSVGNPHCVLVVDNLESVPFSKLGPALECHPAFPDKANVEFVSIDSRHSARQLTWERGVGETLACGTGACAAAFALCETGQADWPLTMRLKGGDLIIDIDNSTGHIIMTGPACTVFSTEIRL